MNISSEIKLLRAALLWARNHLDADDQSGRAAVVERLDRILAGREPTTADMAYMREMYPVPARKVGR